MRKEITFYVFLGEKRDPSEIYANSNLRNLTHITQKPSYVYTFFTSTLKEITALGDRAANLDPRCGTIGDSTWQLGSTLL
jgi:hypothetical protein